MRRCSLVRPTSGRIASGPPRMHTRELRPNLNMSPTLRSRSGSTWSACLLAHASKVHDVSNF